MPRLPRLHLPIRHAGERGDPTRFFGLLNLDERLLRHVGRGRGTFVELGAYDGLNQSNTAWLEAHRGWRGILIEAIPDIYEQCVRNRPLAAVVNCACVSDDYSEPTVEMIYSGLMSIVCGARLSSEADDAWVTLGEEVQQLERYPFTVSARTLTSVLDEHGLRYVDLLSLDVEGYELEVLQGFDHERFRPQQILVEQSGSGDVDRYLTERNYRRVAEIGRGELTHDVLYERAPGPWYRFEALRRPLARWTYFMKLSLRRMLVRRSSPRPRPRRSAPRGRSRATWPPAVAPDPAGRTARYDAARVPELRRRSLR